MYAKYVYLQMKRAIIAINQLPFGTKTFIKNLFYNYYTYEEMYV